MKRTENLVGTVLWLIAFLILVVMYFVISAYGETPIPAPTPGDGATAEEWWDWCINHPKVIYRVSKKWEVSSGGGKHIRPYEERLKVPGPPSLTPFGSIRRWRSYKEHYNTSGFAGLNYQGWNYQTLESLGIGTGPPEDVKWGDQTE